jgi:D-alanyl-D-alanine carboxypeptidase/D-alanyl-D-alanine-endopeptidase (penicillin-binding protein 4)
MNPASVMKLVTTQAALDLLGPTFKWQTHFYTDAVVQQGVLKGNLYIRGGGDPQWVVERIAADFQAIRQQGIDVVQGDVVLDNDLFDVPVADVSAFDGEPLRPYNAAPEALLVNYKAILFSFYPDAERGLATIAFEPPLAGVQVTVSVPLQTGACPDDWRGALQANFQNPSDVRFDGRYAAACGDKIWPVAYVSPQQYALRALEGMWRLSGGQINGRMRWGRVPATAKLLYPAGSRALADVLHDMNKFSNNLIAQQVFLTLGRVSNQQLSQPVWPAVLSDAKRARFDQSQAVVQKWWVQRLGADAAMPSLGNGSGLSRNSSITARSLLALLQYAASRPTASVFINSLPIAGVDGTAAKMGQHNVLRQGLGRLQVKTGTLRDVVSIAGYATTPSGRQLAVAAIINDAKANQGRAVLDAVMEWAATQP